jgi:hypothetical protein
MSILLLINTTFYIKKNLLIYISSIHHSKRSFHKLIQSLTWLITYRIHLVLSFHLFQLSLGLSNIIKTDTNFILLLTNLLFFLSLCGLLVLPVFFSHSLPVRHRTYIFSLRHTHLSCIHFMCLKILF